MPRSLQKISGCAGVLVSHPLDTIKVHLQTQDAKNPLYRGTFHCLRTIIAKDSVKGLYRGMSSPLSGVAFVNAIVFGIYGNVQRNTDDPNSLKSHFLAGSTAGFVQSLVCSPMELIKTRLQLQHDFPKCTHLNGPLQCFRHISRTEGFRGIFRGLSITAIRDVPGFASYFVFYEMMMRNSKNPSAMRTLTAGGLAGTFSWLVTFPIDVVKSRLQADGISGKPQYTSIVDCMRKGYAAEGLSFYTRGLSSTLIRAFPMNAACFLVVSWTMKISEKISFNLNIEKSESLVLLSANSSPVAGPFSGHCFKFQDEHYRRRSHLLKSLLFFGAFSEAVCSTEIMELANDLYDDQYSYFNFNTDSFTRTRSDNEDDFCLISH